MDADAARTMNIVFVAATAVVATIGVAVAYRPASAYRRAEGWAYRARLPFDPAPLRQSVVRRFRALQRGQAWAVVASAVIAAALLLTPLGGEQWFILVALLPALLLTDLACRVAIGMRERLFDPAPDAPRIARLQPLSTRAYLGPVRRALTWVLAGVTALLLGVVALAVVRGDLSAGTAAPAIVTLAIALALAAALPRIDRAILNRPQPASDTVELAWDDALRSDTLASLRLTISVVCLVGIAVAVGALWAGADDWFAASQIIVWGQLALQIVYPPRGFAIMPALRPSAVTA